MIVKYETFSKVISVVKTEERSYNDPIKGFYAQSMASHTRFIMQLLSLTSPNQKMLCHSEVIRKQNYSRELILTLFLKKEVDHSPLRIFGPLIYYAYLYIGPNDSLE